MSNRNKQKTKKEPELRFYHFSQNNTGGQWVFDKDRGLTASVYIQAESTEDANARAESIGIYFNGCEQEVDCDCCGDRWYPAYDCDAPQADPLVEAAVEKLKGEESAWRGEWMAHGENVCIHYIDGTRKWF